MNERQPLIEALYQQAKQGEWFRVHQEWQALPVLARRCSRFHKQTSGWGFLHQAAYFGNEPTCRELIRLGACLEATTALGETPVDIAHQHGHHALAVLLARATPAPGGGWKAPMDPDVHPSSGHWQPFEARQAVQALRVGYGGSTVTIPAGQRYYADEFGRVLIGWHGTYDPPMDMGGWPLVGHAGDQARRRL